MAVLDIHPDRVERPRRDRHLLRHSGVGAFHDAVPAGQEDLRSLPLDPFAEVDGETVRQQQAVLVVVDPHFILGLSHDVRGLVALQDHEILGDNERAGAAYEQALKLDQQGWDPKFWKDDLKKRTKANILNNQGVLWCRRKLSGFEVNSLGAFDKAVNLAPDDPIILLNRAILYHTTKDFGNAIKDYKKVLELLEKEAKPDEKKIKEIREAVEAIETGETGEPGE